MSLLKNILIVLISLNGLIVLIIGLGFLWPKGTMESEKIRAMKLLQNKHDDLIGKFEYSLNIGYLKILENSKRIFLYCFAIAISSILFFLSLGV